MRVHGARPGPGASWPCWPRRWTAGMAGRRMGLGQRRRGPRRGGGIRGRQRPAPCGGRRGRRVQWEWEWGQEGGCLGPPEAVSAARGPLFGGSHPHSGFVAPLPCAARPPKGTLSPLMVPFCLLEVPLYTENVRSDFQWVPSAPKLAPATTCEVSQSLCSTAAIRAPSELGVGPRNSLWGISICALALLSLR